MTKLFRAASSESVVWNLTKTLMQTAVFWTTLLWLVPSEIVRFESELAAPRFVPRPLLGWSTFAMAGILGLWSAWTMATRGRGTPLPMDTASRLVTSGPYQAVRNPMAVAGLAQGLGVGLLLGSWGVLVYVLSGLALWHALIRPLEERDLLERFGHDYESYRKRVGLWLPRRKAR